MENKLESSEVKTKNITIYSILGWILGVIILLTGLINLFSDPLAGIFFLLAGLVALPPVTKIVREKFGFNIKRSVKIIVFIILLTLAGASIKEETTSEVVKENPTPVVAEQTQTPASTPQTLEEKVTGAITSILGSETNMKKQRVIGVEVDKYNASMLSEYGYKAGEEKVGLLVKINASENLTANLQKNTMHKEATQVFQNTFSTDPAIADIIVWSYIPVKDQYGNTKDDVGIIYSMSRELWKKINWANFQYTDLPGLLLSERKLDDRNSYFEKIKF